MNKKNKTITLRMPSDLWEKIKEQAIITNKKYSELVKAIIEKYLGEKQ